MLLSPNAKIRATQVSMATATGLALLKLATALVTGSMALLASAVDSLLDIGMSLVNFLAVRTAEQPPDEDHPFGHGKFETLATLFQSGIIAVSGGLVVLESLRRLLQGATLSRVEDGLLVLLFSAAASWYLTRYLRRVARQTESSALRADALHYAMDVYTNLGLAAGLVLLRWTGADWIDPALSLIVGVYILWEAFGLLRYGLQDVLDAELPASVRQEVERLIRTHEHHLVDFHRLRTRRAGSQKIMDFHLTVCKHLTVQEAHEIADHLEQRIQQEIRGADVTIHIEPCAEMDCPQQQNCPADKIRPSQKE